MIDRQVREEIEDAVFKLWRASGRTTNHEIHVAAQTVADSYDVETHPEHVAYAKEMVEDYTLDCPAGCDRQPK